MLARFTPSSDIVVGMLVVCLAVVLVCEATNGFHDTSNAVATVSARNRSSADKLLIDVAVTVASPESCSVVQRVDRKHIVTVLEGLALSSALGFLLAGGL